MNLKDLRTKRSLTQQQVADAIGCSVMVYSRYERETRQPSIDVLIRLSDLFGVTIDYLVGKSHELDKYYLLSQNDKDKVIDFIESLTSKK